MMNHDGRPRPEGRVFLKKKKLDDVREDRQVT